MADVEEEDEDRETRRFQDWARHLHEFSKPRHYVKGCSCYLESYAQLSRTVQIPSLCNLEKSKE